jgi:hypothetical protein
MKIIDKISMIIILFVILILSFYFWYKGYKEENKKVN